MQKPIQEVTSSGRPTKNFITTSVGGTSRAVAYDSYASFAPLTTTVKLPSAKEFRLPAIVYYVDIRVSFLVYEIDPNDPQRGVEPTIQDIVYEKSYVYDSTWQDIQGASLFGVNNTVVNYNDGVSLRFRYTSETPEEGGDSLLIDTISTLDQYVVGTTTITLTSVYPNNLLHFEDRPKSFTVSTALMPVVEVVDDAVEVDVPKAQKKEKKHKGDRKDKKDRKEHKDKKKDKK